MRQLAAILQDSLREALATRALYVLLAIATFVIVFTFGLRIEGVSREAVLREQITDLDEFSKDRGNVSIHRSAGVDVEILEIRPAPAGDALPDSFDDGHVAVVRFPSAAQLERWARAWEHFRTDPGAALDDDAAVVAAVDDADPIEALRTRFSHLGYDRFQAVRTADEPPEFEIALAARYPHEVRGAHRLGLLFGAVHVPLPGTSVAELVVMMQLGLADAFAGLLGMVVAIVVTAGFVPRMLQKGTLDLVLARPIGRTRLLLAKYAGGLWFILLLAVYLVAGCWLGFAVSTGYANPWFLATAATITLQFAVLYAVSVLVGVLTGSSGVAALITLGVWIASSTVSAVRAAGVLWGSEPGGALATMIDVLHAILPKAGEIGDLNDVFLARSYLSEEALQRSGLLDLPEVDWFYAAGTTAAFTAVVLGLAVLVFRRRDY